jgi:predicted  nucleic acid-binding Zn-ribbon protein
MSTRWRCGVCEAVNDGGQTCVACGATVTQTVTQASPAQAEPAREAPARDETPAREDLASEIPVRELPGRKDERETPYYGSHDVYDYFDTVPTADPDAGYDSYESTDVRPRVRVYGCCLPISLGMLLVFAGAVTLLGDLVVQAL